MRRRDVLALAGGSLTVALAGCSGDDGGDDDDSEESGEASFELSGLNPSNASAETGATLTVTAELTNTGDADGSTTVEFQVNGETLDTQEVELAAEQSMTVSFDVDTSALQPGEFTHAIVAGDASVEGTLTLAEVLPATFEVSNLDPVDATVDIGTMLTVSADVTNTGDEAGETSVEFRLNGSTQDAQQLQLGAGATETVTFEVDTASLEAGEFTHSIWTPDGEAEGSLTLELVEAETGTLALNAVDAEELSVDGASVTGEGIDGETDAEGVYETELAVGTYDLTVATAELEGTTTVEIVADETTEVTVELLPDESDLPELDSFQGTNTDGFISFDEDNESDARSEGLAFEEGNVTIEGTVEGNSWESTDTNFEPLETDRGVEAQTTAPNGLTGEIDREEDYMTAEGTLIVDVEGETFSFEISMTTEVSGALSGDATLDAEGGSATLVDNEYTVPEGSGDPVLDSVLGLPIEEPGKAWIELLFDLEFQTAE